MVAISPSLFARHLLFATFASSPSNPTGARTAPGRRHVTNSKMSDLLRAPMTYAVLALDDLDSTARRTRHGSRKNTARPRDK